MAGPVHLRVLTQAGLALEDDAVSVRAPGELGSLGMLRNHAPLVTTLVPGTLRWRRTDGTTHARLVGGGLLEIAKNRLTVLTSSVQDLAPALAGSRA